MPGGAIDARILVLTPPGRDQALTAQVLADGGLEACACADVTALVAEIARGAGVVLASEEMLTDGAREQLKTALDAQPAWSDLPVLLLSAFRRDSLLYDRSIFRELGNVTVLERPVRIGALLSTVVSALRARLRQYELRDHVHRMRESEARERARAAELESLLRVVPAAIFFAHDPACARITGNRVAYEWLHASGDNVSANAASESARDFREYRDGRPVPAHELPMQRAAATRVPVMDEELELRFTDGTTRHLLGNAVPLLDESGAARGAVAAFVDVGRLKAAEAASRRQAESLRLLAEAAAVVLQMQDADAMAESLFHHIGAHLSLDTYLSFAACDDGRRLRLKSSFGVPDANLPEVAELDFGVAVCGRVAQSGTMIVVNHVQHSDDAAAAWVRGIGLTAYVSFPLIADGRLIGTLSFGSRSRPEFDSEALDFLATVCHYVTLGAERVRLIGRLRQDDRRKDEFLATLAHELRNPLAPIRQAAAIARAPGAAPGQVRWSHEVIERQTRHMALLLDDLLDISRVTRGRLALKPSQLLVTEVVQAAVETARPEIDAHGHTLEVLLPDASLAVHGDAIRLAQVLSNLLTNAAKYTPPGGRIRVTARQEAQTIEIVVADTGIGLAPDQLERVFEMFTQGSAPAELQQGGLGIGLALARGLANLHGGSLEARSAGIGHGSQFVVRLPAMAGSDALDAPPVRSPGAPASAKRVLVVDDNVDAAESLSVLLRLHGHETATAHDGAAALDKAARWKPEVVLLDLGMPGMDGCEVARRLRAGEAGRHLTLVAVTGWGQAEDRQRTKAAGFDEHLTKPVDLERIARIVAVG
jgi:signal transduction histidine kinase/response regulator RpfG family c-di-GMP phosphodiesterase